MKLKKKSWKGLPACLLFSSWKVEREEKKEREIKNMKEVDELSEVLGPV